MPPQQTAWRCIELDPTFERQEGAAIPTPTSRMTRGNGGLAADVKRHEGMEDPTPAQIGIGAEPPGFAPFFFIYLHYI